MNKKKWKNASKERSYSDSTKITFIFIKANLHYLKD